jgi:hypothetical protein
MSHDGYYNADGGSHSAQQPSQPFGGNNHIDDMPRIHVPIQDAYMGDGDDTPGGRAAAERRGSASPGLSFSLNGDYQRTGSTHSLHSSSSALDLSQASVFDVVKEARKVIRAFLLEHQCYELIKNSGKVRTDSIVTTFVSLFYLCVDHDGDHAGGLLFCACRWWCLM